MKYIKFFNEIDKTQTQLFGGKAASLGEMTQSKLPIPNGFAINVRAFEEFNGKSMSSEFEAELLKAFDKLGAPRVAVRSSAVAEDSGGASWAGQLESYLNVTRVKLEDNVRKCWSSINTQRAISYAEDKKINDKDRLVGVVVQAMIDSEKSGVMFTVDPISKDQNKMIIESLFGLGEMIVQGIVTPDNYQLTKDPLKVDKYNISIKAKQMIYDGKTNRITKVSENLEDKASLRENDVINLAKLGIKIEKHYKLPQDIEWAIYRSKIYIVQSRPITTL